MADERVEGAAYDFTVEAVNGDSFSLTLHGADRTFDGHTFAPGSGTGLVSGDIVVRP